MFGAEVALKRFGDVGFGVAAAVVAKFGELVRITFTGEDSADDGKAGLAGDIGDDEGEFEVHDLQSLVHMLNMLSTALDEGSAVAGVSSGGTGVFIRMERAAQEAEGMKLLDPLAILNIRFTTGDIFEMMSIDEFDIKAAVIKDFKDGYPVDAGGFHGDGGDAAGREPIGELMEVGGKGGEGTDGLVITVRGNTDPDFGGTDIETGGVKVDLSEGV